MLIIAAAPSPPAFASVELDDGSASSRAPDRAGSSRTGSDVLHEITCGTTRYRLRKGLYLRYSWSAEAWYCWADDFGPRYIGHGETPPAARQACAETIHAAFQRLYAMRPFEMLDSDRAEWHLLVAYIDVLHYRETSPVAAREVGVVRWGAKPFPSKVHWIDGRRESFQLSEVPAELAGCSPGQCIEAIVERDPSTGRLRRIQYVQKIPTIHALSPSQLAEAEERMPAADLPEAAWEWPE